MTERTIVDFGKEIGKRQTISLESGKGNDGVRLEAIVEMKYHGDGGKHYVKDFDKVTT